MSEYKEYIVTLKNKDDLDNFYKDMESLGSRGATPHRQVECCRRRPISRNTHYYLTPEEAEVLKKDERVLSISKTIKELGIEIRPCYNQTENFWDKSSNIGEDPSYQKNWGLLRCVEGQQRTDWGYDITPNQSGSINVTSSGLNVDVVIVDGHIDPNHPEYAVNSDGSGGTRVIQYNWYQNNPEVTGGAAGTYVYTIVNNGDNNHGAHVAGIVSGNTQGWARNANIYNIQAYTTDPYYLIDYIRAFHRHKSINPKTGIKNPTILNCSWGYSFSLTGYTSKIVSVFYRGSLISGPFTEAQLSSYGIGYYYSGTYSCDIEGYYTPTDVDIIDAINEGIIIVAAAGNSNSKIDISDGIDYNNYFYGPQIAIENIYYNRGGTPASTYKVLCVGSTSALSNDSKVFFSCRGPRINLFSPGNYIISSINRLYTPWTHASDPRNINYYLAKISGTSMASPQVCGVLACALEQYPSMDQDKAIEYITHYAKSSQIPDTGGDFTDLTSLMGAPNKYLYYYKERPDNGVTCPKQNKNIRPTTGLLYPRFKIRR